MPLSADFGLQHQGLGSHPSAAPSAATLTPRASGRAASPDRQNSPLGSSSSLLASSSTLTSLNVTTRTVFAKRAGR